MAEPVNIAVIGAGPYGLSVAAHLKAAGVPYRQFGVPMGLWRTAMPRGMYLKSQGFASNLSDPAGAKTLAAFCAAAGRPYADYGAPVPLEAFVDYGRWFAEQLSLSVKETLVTSVTRDGEGFLLTAGDGEPVAARAVVVAIGVECLAALPAPLSGLPPALCTHTSAHTDLSVFRGKRVVVVGAGQSALESAALLCEDGADVQLLARAPRLAWNGAPLPLDRPLPRRLREPESGLGSGWAIWFYSNHPELYRRLPPATRARRAATALGPAGASWLRDRVEGRFPVRCGHQVTAAEARGDQVRLTVTSAAGRAELTADHVIAGTGYRPDLSRLGFLSEDIRSALPTLGGGVRVGRGYESAVPGLYFAGPLVASSYGPVMRFVFGARHAAREITRQLAGQTGAAAPAMAASR